MSDDDDCLFAVWFCAAEEETRDRELTNVANDRNAPQREEGAERLANVCTHHTSQQEVNTHAQLGEHNKAGNRRDSLESMDAGAIVHRIILIILFSVVVCVFVCVCVCVCLQTLKSLKGQLVSSRASSRRLSYLCCFSNHILLHLPSDHYLSIRLLLLLPLPTFLPQMQLALCSFHPKRRLPKLLLI